MENFKYVLISAVFNEEKYIEKTIKSVISQTIKPIKWIIVSDNSTDDTEKIVSKFVESYNFIQLIKYTNTDTNKITLGKVARHVVAAFEEGYKKINDREFDYIGILDGDVSFKNDYYEKLMLKFQNNQKLGLAGGYI